MIGDIPKFLDELCIRLDICLSPEGRASIARTPARDVDAMEEAILLAGKIDPLRVKQRLRDDLRDLIKERWTG